MAETRPDQPFFQASAEELAFVDAGLSVADRVGLQDDLARKILGTKERNQSYIDSETFQAIMFGAIVGADASEACVPKTQQDFIAKLGPLAFAADEPFSMTYASGELNYLGFIRPNQYGKYPGDPLIYSIYNAAPYNDGNETTGPRLWGQVLMYDFHIGVSQGRADSSWKFDSAHELGVVFRELGKADRRVLSSKGFEDPLGLPSIRAYLKKHERPELRDLNRLLAEARAVYNKTPLNVPGSSYPPVNNR